MAWNDSKRTQCFNLSCASEKQCSTHPSQIISHEKQVMRPQNIISIKQISLAFLKLWEACVSIFAKNEEMNVNVDLIAAKFLIIVLMRF